MTRPAAHRAARPVWHAYLAVAVVGMVLLSLLIVLAGPATAQTR